MKQRTFSKYSKQRNSWRTLPKNPTFYFIWKNCCRINILKIHTLSYAKPYLRNLMNQLLKIYF